MTLNELKPLLDDKLTKPFSARVLLDNLRMIEESSRKTSPYTDPLYIPVYYHLGTLIRPKNVLEIGVRLGLFTSCFLKGCKTVERVLGYQRAEEDYSPRLARGNIRQQLRKGRVDIYVGEMTDEGFDGLLNGCRWDLVMVNDEVQYDRHLSYLDTVWPHIELDGFLVVDYITRHHPSRAAFLDFCKGKSREPVTFDTRYGLGIVQK